MSVYHIFLSVCLCASTDGCELVLYMHGAASVQIQKRTSNRVCFWEKKLRSRSCVIKARGETSCYCAWHTEKGEEVATLWKAEAGCARGQPGIHSESRADLDYSIDSVSKTEKGAGGRGEREEKEGRKREMKGGWIVAMFIIPWEVEAGGSGVHTHPNLPTLRV